MVEEVGTEKEKESIVGVAVEMETELEKGVGGEKEVDMEKEVTEDMQEAKGDNWSDVSPVKRGRSSTSKSAGSAIIGSPSRFSILEDESGENNILEGKIEHKRQTQISANAEKEEGEIEHISIGHSAEDDVNKDGEIAHRPVSQRAEEDVNKEDVNKENGEERMLRTSLHRTAKSKEGDGSDSTTATAKKISNAGRRRTTKKK